MVLPIPNVDDRAGMCDYVLYRLYQEAGGVANMPVVALALRDVLGLYDTTMATACEDARAAGWITFGGGTWQAETPAVVLLTDAGVAKASLLDYPPVPSAQESPTQATEDGPGQ